MLIALLLFAAAFLLAAVSGRSLRHTLPLTVTGAALAVYGCTWLNHKSGAYPLLWLALAVLAVLAVRQARQKRLALPPAGQTLLFLGLILLLWAATRDWVPAFVDDRNHWEIFAAQMVRVERFPTGIQSCSEFSDYPPLTGVFLAFLQPAHRTVDIGLLYFGQRLLYMVLSLPILPGWPRKKSCWLKMLSALCQALFVLFVPALFSEYAVYALAPDTLMGFFVAWGIIIAWRSRENGPDWFAMLQIQAVLLALPLCKQTGILFALITALCVTLLLMRRTRWYLTLLWWLAPVASWGSWQLMCRIRGLSSYLTEEAKTAYTFEHLKQMLFNPKSWSKTLLDYIHTLALEPINNGVAGLSALGFAVILGILLWRLICHNSTWRLAIYRVGLTLFICTSLFAVALCFSYLFLFMEWEREVFSAYTRYMSPFAAASTLWILHLTFRSGGLQNCQRWDKMAMICLVCLAVTLNWQVAVILQPQNYTNEWGDYQQGQAKVEELLSTLSLYLQNCNPQEAPIVLVTLNDVYYSPLGQCMNYILSPSQVEVIYREDYGVTAPPDAYAQHLRTALEKRNYNVFFACQDVEEWLPYADMKDYKERPLEVNVVYVLKDDGLQPIFSTEKNI